MRPGKSALAVAVLASALVAPGSAFAQQAGFYLGGAFGQSKFKEWCKVGPTTVLLACEDTDTGWKLLAGYRFNRYLAVEGTYVNWGEVTGTLGGPTRDVSAEQTGMGIAAVGSLELGPQFSVFGKAGFLMTEQETRSVSATSSTSADREETEFHYGLGVKFRFTPNWAARGEWERTEKLKVEMLSIGVEYRF